MKTRKPEPFFYFAAGEDFAVFIAGVRAEKALVPVFMSVWIIVNNNPIDLDDPLGYGVAIGPMGLGGLIPPGSGGSAGTESRDPTKQDWRCSSIAAPLNRNPCIKACCILHDACYTAFHCNQSSWFRTLFLRRRTRCSWCNELVVECMAEAAVSPECWCWQ